MSELFGFTRNVVKEKYALLTPSGFVPSNLPGWEKAVCNVLISPAMGARFSQVLITMEKDGQCMGNILILSKRNGHPFARFTKHLFAPLAKGA